MNSLNNKLEVFKYNENKLSVKDLDEDIDISNPKWDFIFEFFISRTERFYFVGERLEYSDENFKETLSLLCEKEIDTSKDYHKVIIKLKPSNVIVNRNLLSKAWLYYEFPCLLFVDEDFEEDLKGLFTRELSYDEIVGRLPKTYMLHRSFEPNVLWIEKSFDVSFSLF